MEGQGPLKCWERFVNSILCASNDPQTPRKPWRKKCLDCLKPVDPEELDQAGQENTPKRETWGSRCTFFMTTLGMSVGLGQVWRFPVLAYTYGGGVFLLLYGFFLFTYGNAIFFFEVINGQYTSKNPLKVYDKVPLFIGTGWCMIMYAFLFCTYYNHMVSFSLLYLFNSFTARLPWSFCPENEKDIFDTHTCLPLAKLREPKMDGIICGNKAIIYNNTLLCSDTAYADEQKVQCCYEKHIEGDSCDALFNVTDLCRTREFPSSFFWSHSVAKLYRDEDPMHGYLGDANWKLLGFSFLAWFLAYAALYKGIKSLGVIMYVLVPLPYIVLFIMFGIAIPQEGALDGLLTFLIPEPSALLNMNVWRVASEQAFYSVGVAMGPLITFGSYSKFDSPSHVDCALICLCIFLTSVVSGSVVFSVLGFLAKQSGIPFSKVVLPGPGLVFIVYPEALDLLPGAQFFCFLFYLMLINLGLSSVTGIIETVPSAVYDIWPITRKFKYLVNMGVLFSAFLLGLPITFRGGLNYYNSFDTFSAGMTLIPICIIEMSIVVFIYGIGRFCEDINFMLGFYPNRFYRWQWLVGPFSLLLIFMYGVITMSLPPMRTWQVVLGSLLFIMVLIWIPVGMVYTLTIYAKKNELKNVLKSPPEHGPKNPEKFEERKDFSVKRKIF